MILLALSFLLDPGDALHSLVSLGSLLLAGSPLLIPVYPCCSRKPEPLPPFYSGRAEGCVRAQFPATGDFLKQSSVTDSGEDMNE